MLVNEEIELKVVEDTAKVVHVILPAEASGELSDADLAKVAGGVGFSSLAMTLNPRLLENLTIFVKKTTEPPH